MSAKMDFIVTVYLSVVLFGVTQAFSTGAVANASNPMEGFSSFCLAGNFRPNHMPYMPQAESSPYVLTVINPSGTTYKPGQKATVIIESLTQGETFKGFFIQGDCSRMAFAGTITCEQGHATQFCNRPGVTHTNAAPKAQVICSWTPPDYEIGSVRFVATIVRNFSDFWTGVKSKVVLTPDPSTMTYEQKAQQLREQMLAGAQRMFGAAGGKPGTNPLAALMRRMQGQGKANLGGSNPWGRQQQQQQQQQQGSGLGFDSKNLLSMFGSEGSPGPSSNLGSFATGESSPFGTAFGQRFGQS